MRGLLRRRAFAVLFGAEVQSTVGDQLARVALSVLVFQRTNSSAATAATYATTFLPAIGGGVALAGLGDRYGYRIVMVGSDAIRVLAFAVMAVRGLPLAVVIAALVVAVFVGPAHTAAQVSYLAAALDPQEFRAATGIRLATGQTAQVIGFGFGGGVVAVIGPRSALLVDAATFLVAAAVIGSFLRVAAPAATPGRQRPRPSGRPGTAGVLRGTPAATLHTAVGLCWLQGFFVVPEGLAVPYGASVGASTTEVGLLLAALPFGGAVGAFVVTRRIALRSRRPSSRLMAVLTGAPLVLCAMHLPVLLVVLAWSVSGALAAYQIEVMSEIVQQVAARDRARIIGRVGAGLLTVQGLGLALFGALAQATGVRPAVAWAGAAGVLLAVVITTAESARRREPGPVETEQPPAIRSRRQPRPRPYPHPLTNAGHRAYARPRPGPGR